jgi:acetyl/propionyl-CoA carboxylase alpha subunit
MEIPIYYDPMIAKLITYGQTREEAIERMKRAIEDYKINGVSTTLGFCHFVMNHKSFVTGKFDTHFVKNYFKPFEESFSEDEMKIASIIALKCLQTKSSGLKYNKSTTNGVSNWKQNRLLNS